jgi:hypothetical protein
VEVLAMTAEELPAMVEDRRGPSAAAGDGEVRNPALAMELRFDDSGFAGEDVRNPDRIEVEFLESGLGMTTGSLHAIHALSRESTGARRRK